MHIRIDNDQPCEAATLLRSHVYNDRNLWLLERAGAHDLRVVMHAVDADSDVRVRCGNPSILGEVVAQLVDAGERVVVSTADTVGRTDDTVAIDVPSGHDAAVVIALFRALCLIARPAQQSGPAPRRRWFFSPQ